MAVIAPSVLACDFANLEREIKKVHGYGCEYLHLDIMDGVFVNNISFGVPVISGIRKTCDIIFDAHLMISEPSRYIREFAEAGADIINFHAEACGSEQEILDTLGLIKKYGKKCALAIKPATPAQALEPFLDIIDMALVMSVEPGFGGQKFIESSLGKLRRLAELRRAGGYNFDIEVDGGVTLGNAAQIREAGADIIVAGSSIFGAADMGSAISGLRG